MALDADIAPTIRKNIYMWDEQVTFELYDNFLCLQVLYSKLNYIY